MKQVLAIVPHGIIQSGQVSYAADEQTGLIDFSESVVVGWSIFTKTIQDSKFINIDPQLLLSKNLRGGMKFLLGKLTIEIDAAYLGGQGQASVFYQDGDDHLHGLVEIDLSEELMQISHVLANGVMQGTEVVLELQKQ